MLDACFSGSGDTHLNSSAMAQRGIGIPPKISIKDLFCYLLLLKLNPCLNMTKWGMDISHITYY